MVLIDSDVIVVDQRYQRDSRFAVNRRFLVEFQRRGMVLGVTTQALLESCGIISFNVSVNTIPLLADSIARQYRLSLIPDMTSFPEYANCAIAEILTQLTHRMALGDAVQAVQIAKFAPPDSVLVTWNAKHFLGKHSIPVMTPAEWLAANPLKKRR